jgi:hypothetical protein
MKEVELKDVGTVESLESFSESFKGVVRAGGRTNT